MSQGAADFGIYIHAPWCRTRCPYCAFNVTVDRAAPFAAWGEAVARHWAATAHAFPGACHSLYFGGGTPSLVPPAVIGAVIDALPAGPGAEITLEANPGTLSAAALADYRAAGVNRVSVGIQTFNPHFARLLNRGHTVREAHALCRLVAEAELRSWSVDVIFALPGQRLSDLEVDLAAILALDPPHVSLYGLTFEPGTPFGRAADQGRLRPLDEESWRSMYDHTVETLEAGGWERYEVSNFARRGHRAVHNEAVWRGGPYAGLGPGAHGFEPDGHRTLNRADTAAWMQDPVEERVLPDREEAAIDLVLSTLRHRDGLPLATLRARCGREVAIASLAPLLSPPTGEALLVHTGSHLRLTRAGFPLADGVVARVCAALTSPVETPCAGPGRLPLG